MVSRVIVVPKTAPAVPSPWRRRPEALTEALVEMGALSSEEALRALVLAQREDARLVDILYIRGMVDEATLLEAQARIWQTRVADPRQPLPDARLVDRFGAHRCLSEGLVPWVSAGGAVVIATIRPEQFERHRAELTRLYGPVAMCVAAEATLTEAVLAVRAPALASRAETRVPDAESCRAWLPSRLRERGSVIAGMVLMTLLLWPVLMLGTLTLWAVLTMFMTVALKGGAALATLRARAAARHAPPQPPDQPEIVRLPCVSVMVPVFHETDVAPRLIGRLSRLDYPRELLDIVLITEEEDVDTRQALADHGLPRWMRVLTAPAGQLKTKPRALNFALDLCRGSIVGIWDAEDAPDRDQIHRIVRRFHERGADVACLQGRLDYYNPRTNWMARCFTIEYAAWFRVVLPGLEQLGLPLPLGGTTLFFRRAALESLGGWDAHNVTEDADLGMRLARHGLRTEMVETTTEEEANCRALPWIRQRSRWIKGYLMTWAVHMRTPRTTLRQLGWWRFAGFQVLFLGTLSQQLLAPVLWSFWLILAGVWHPLAGMAGWASVLLMVLFVATETINAAVGVIGIAGSRHRYLLPWVPTLIFYFPMTAFAAYKALWEIAVRPFYWDKTAHGLFDADAPGRLPE